MNKLENVLIKIDLEKGYKLLTKREKNIIILYYLEGYKDEEIAKIYGICQQSINESRQNGINKLKKYYDDIVMVEKMEEESSKRLFRNSGYRWSIIGNMKHIERVKLSDMIDFFNRYYGMMSLVRIV